MPTGEIKGQTGNDVPGAGKLEKDTVSALLSASDQNRTAPNSALMDKALRDLGVPTTVGQPSIVPHGFNDYTLAQQRLMAVTRTIQESLGEHSTLTAADLHPMSMGTLQGVLPNDQLDKIITSKDDSYWQFRQADNQTIDAFQVNSNTTDPSTGRLGLSKGDVAEKLAARIEQTIPNGMLAKVLDDLGSHELGQLAYLSGADGAMNHVVQKHISTHAPGKLGLLGAAATLSLAAAQAKASEGSTLEKAEVFAKTAAEAVPGVTYIKKMSEGKYEEAATDAAGYLPSGMLTALAREPKVQAVIDALPKDHQQLNKMLQDPKTPYIDRHLAEYRLRYLDAKEHGNFFSGIEASNKLTELAEKKLVLQAEWQKDAETFATASRNPQTNWHEFAKNNPNLLVQAATHVAAVNEGHSEAFIQLVDEKLIKNTTHGIPLDVNMQTKLQEANHNQSTELVL